jgi:hypothetical protein
MQREWYDYWFVALLLGCAAFWLWAMAYGIAKFGLWL